MPDLNLIKSSFAGGEIAPSLYSRTDLALYGKAAKLLQNWIVHPHGGVSNRSGTVYEATAKFENKKIRLIPFRYSTLQNYMIEFGDYYARFYTNLGAGGQILDGAYSVDSYVKLLMHFDGANNGVVLTEETGKTVTNSGMIEGMTVAYDSGELAAAATSITITGLNGDVDGEYELIYRLVNGYAGGLGVTIRPNNDSGSSYGNQLLYGVNTDKYAARQTNTSINESIDGASQITFGTFKIQAKSGQQRTFIGKCARGIATTTVSVVMLRGDTWTNTADNLTSLVITADQANGLGIGSRVILLKKSATPITKTWEEIYTKTITGSTVLSADKIDDGTTDYTGYHFRFLLAAATMTDVAGTKMRFRFTAPASANVGIDLAYVGERDGTGWNIKASPTKAKLTFAGADSKTITAGTSEWSDWITFTTDGTKDLLLSVDFGTMANNAYNGSFSDKYWAATNGAADDAAPALGTEGVWYFSIDRVETSSDVATSLTIPSLTGDTDVLYRLRARVVNGYNGGTYLEVRPNNDTGSNYGYQDVFGQDTGALASRSVNGYIYAGYLDALNNITSVDLLLYAKSDYVRTGIGKTVRSVSGTTVNSIFLSGHSWNNTADEITSLVIVATQANGLGIGTTISLERLNL